MGSCTVHGLEARATKNARALREKLITMKSQTQKLISVAFASGLLCSALVQAADKINFEDHLTPILRNECASCHNPDKKKAGLDLSTYQGLMAGSENGPVVNPGDPDGSVLYKVIAHLEDPYMPKGKAKLADKDIDVFKQFIAMGALETASGKPAVAKNRPKLNLSLASADTGKPTGPIAMPKDLILEPVVHTPRPGALLCLAASPWAPLVAVGGQHQILYYNTDTLDLQGVIPWPEGDPYTAKFSRNGAVLMVGGGIAAKSGHVVLFDVASGKRITQIGDEFDAVIAADISPNQAMVALGGPSKVLKIFSTDGQLLHSIKKHTDWVTAINYSPDGVLLASGDRAGGLWVWEANTGNEFYGLTGHKGAITDICFRGDSNVLASASEDGTVKLWDMKEGKEIKTINANGGGVASIQFTHDGRLVTCGRDHVVRIFKPDGSPLANSQPFADIALHAAFDGEGKRVVAGDWTGELRVIDAADGKTIGELTADPQPIADRLDAATKHLPEAQAAYDKAAADLAAAQKASDKSAADLQAANLASAEAKKNLDSALALDRSTAATIQSAAADAKTATDNANSKQNDANRMMQIAQQSAQARDAADRDRKAAADAVTAKQKSLDEANAKADKAKSDADKSPDNQQLAAAAKDARSAADRANQELADAQKTFGNKSDKLNALPDQANKAKSDADSANTAANAARQEAASKQAALDKAQKDHQTAVTAVGPAQQAVPNADKLIAQRTNEAKAAAEQLAKVKAPADAAAQQLADAKSRITRLKAAQFNVTVWAARDDLSAKQAELDKLNQAVVDSKAALDKANADLQAAQKALSEGPGKLPADRDAMAKAKLALAGATTARDAMQAVFNTRQSLAQEAGDLSTKLAAEAAKSQDDKVLADAAAKAKVAMDAVNAELESVKTVLAAKSQAMQDAQTAAASADAALTKQQQDIDSAPKRIETLKQAIAAATADIPKQQAAADAFVKTLASVKSHVDELAAQYQKLSQEASAPATNAPGVPPKS